MTRPVIVADDDACIRTMVAYMVRDAIPNIEIHEVTNGKELTRRVLEGDYSFVITDNDMAGGNGVDAVREIRKHNASIPICLMSGRPDAENQARNAGATDFISKPFTYEEIKPILTRYYEIRGK